MCRATRKFESINDDELFNKSITRLIPKLYKRVLILQADNFENACIAAEHNSATFAKIHDWDLRGWHSRDGRDKSDSKNNHWYDKSGSNKNNGRYWSRGKEHASIEGIN